MENENILTIEQDQPVANAPASLPVALIGSYPLDANQVRVSLKGGCVVTFRRPTAAEVLDRDAEMQLEIPMGRDGSYALPDPTINDTIDAKFFDLIKTEVTGFKGEMMEQHKAEAIKGLYGREIYVDENFDITDETVPVFEEIGSGAEPDFTITHIMRPPTESELKLYRRKSAAGELKPGKRGRQKFVMRSTLKMAMDFYAQWLVGIQGATVDGQDTELLQLPVLTGNVDPLIQRQVVNAVVEAFTAALSD